MDTDTIGQCLYEIVFLFNQTDYEEEDEVVKCNKLFNRIANKLIKKGFCNDVRSSKFNPVNKNNLVVKYDSVDGFISEFSCLHPPVKYKATQFGFEIT